MSTTINFQRNALRDLATTLGRMDDAGEPGAGMAVQAILHALNQKYPLVTLRDMISDRRACIASDGDISLDLEWEACKPDYDPDSDACQHDPTADEVAWLEEAEARANGQRQL